MSYNVILRHVRENKKKKTLHICACAVPVFGTKYLELVRARISFPSNSLFLPLPLLTSLNTYASGADFGLWTRHGYKHNQNSFWKAVRVSARCLVPWFRGEEFELGLAPWGGHAILVSRYLWDVRVIYCKQLWRVGALSMKCIYMYFLYLLQYILYKVVNIWPGLFVCIQVTVCPGHIWTTLYYLNLFFFIVSAYAPPWRLGSSAR
jgi:hypothetical protein